MAVTSAPRDRNTRLGSPRPQPSSIIRRPSTSIRFTALASALLAGHNWPNKLQLAEQIPARFASPYGSAYCSVSLRARIFPFRRPIRTFSFRVASPDITTPPIRLDLLYQESICDGSLPL